MGPDSEVVFKVSLADILAQTTLRVKFNIKIAKANKTL
jgi:hypothetical protein